MFRCRREIESIAVLSVSRAFLSGVYRCDFMRVSSLTRYLAYIYTHPASRSCKKEFTTHANIGKKFRRDCGTHRVPRCGWKRDDPSIHRNAFPTPVFIPWDLRYHTTDPPPAIPLSHSAISAVNLLRHRRQLRCLHLPTLTLASASTNIREFSFCTKICSVCDFSLRERRTTSTSIDIVNHSILQWTWKYEAFFLAK